MHHPAKPWLRDQGGLGSNSSWALTIRFFWPYDAHLSPLRFFAMESTSMLARILTAVLRSHSRTSLARRRLTRSAASESLEVRALLTAAPFQQHLLYANTVMPEADDRFTMQVGEWNNDSVSDIFQIQRSGTASGNVEVSVYSTQFSNFDARHDGQTTPWIALLPVAMTAANADWDFRIDHWGGGTKPDLFAIHKANTASGFVELTIFTGESNFTSSSGVFQTTLPSTGRDWVFDLGHYNNDGMIDLFAIRRNGAIATEVFVASGANPVPSALYSTLLVQGNSAMPRTDHNYDFVVGDLGNDGVADLFAIRKSGTEFGRVEISVLPGTTSGSGALPFQWFSIRTAAGLADIGFDWNFDVEYFNSPHGSPDDGIIDLVGLLKFSGGSPGIHFLSGVPHNPTDVFGAAAVPSTALSTTIAQTTAGLVGSYVNSSLRSYAAQDDWRVTQAIVGSRVDSSINFATNSFGSRAAVGINGGRDSDWNFFSVQWDGYISIPADGVRLRTNSSDGSRLWIDLNGDGQFGSTGDEYVNNGWGKGQDVTLGPLTVQLQKGTYKIRLQFENGTGPNPMQLLWDFAPTAVPLSAYFTDAGKSMAGITGSYVNASLHDPGAPLDFRQSPSTPISGTRVDPAIYFPRHSFGTRSSVGLTSGTDNNWDYFMVQWDGYVVIPANGVRLFTRSDDGSRLWIDVNGDGVFSNTAAETLLNGFGTGQVPTTSAGSPPLNAGTYRIRAQYEEGSGGNSMQLLWDYDPIQVPSPVIAGTTSSFEQRPTISWSSTTGAAGYEIWIDNLTTNTSAVVRASTGESWYTPTMDLGIGQFAVWVRSIAVNGNQSAWSPRFTFRINTPVTIQPLEFTQSTARPVVSWNPVPGAVRYDVWIDNLATQQSQYVRLTNVVGTQWTSATDLPMGRYRMWVRGIDATGVAANWSLAKDFVIATAPIPVAPLLPTFDRTPTLTWTALAGAVSYKVTLKNPNTGVIAYSVNGITGTSWTVPADLLTGTWQWWVSGTSADGYQSAAPQKVDFYVGGRPTVLTPTGTTSSTQPEFTWTAVTGAATYDLWVNRLDVPVAGLINVTGLTEARFTPSTAMSTGTYRIWVRAVSTTGEISIWSAAVDFSIVHAAPVQPERFPWDDEYSALASFPGVRFGSLSRGEAGRPDWRPNKDATLRHPEENVQQTASSYRSLPQTTVNELPVPQLSNIGRTKPDSSSVELSPAAFEIALFTMLDES